MKHDSITEHLNECFEPSEGINLRLPSNSIIKYKLHNGQLSQKYVLLP